MGDFFCDAVKEFHKVDVVLINGGSMRGNKVFEAGDLTKAIVTAMHPFGNQIVKIWATGKEIRQYINSQLDCYEDVCGNFVQVAGLKYSFNPIAPKGQRLVALTHTDGTIVTDDEKFTLGITDYMLSTSPLKHNKLFEMTTLNDAVPIVLALFAAVQKRGDSCIAPETDGRILKI
uniref:5'-Nucleotidase C-terminal domain-containing protein n=1 Tax=Alexandrium andersonii TaxID=327968 RepID=A0A7S2DT10_9DINO